MIIRIRLSEGHGSTIKQLFPYFKKDIAKFIKNVFFEKDISNIDSLTSDPIASGIRLSNILSKLSPKFQTAKQRLNAEMPDDLIYYKLLPNIMSHYILTPGPARFASPETGSDEFKITIGIYYNPEMLKMFSYEDRVSKIKNIFEKLIKELSNSIEHELRHWYQTVFDHPQERSKKIRTTSIEKLLAARIDFLTPEEVFAYARENIKTFISLLKKVKEEEKAFNNKIKLSTNGIVHKFILTFEDEIYSRLEYNYPKLPQKQVQNIAHAHVTLVLMAIKAIRPDLFKIIQEVEVVNQMIKNNYQFNPEVKRALKNFKVKLKPA